MKRQGESPSLFRFGVSEDRWESSANNDPINATTNYSNLQGSLIDIIQDSLIEMVSQNLIEHFLPAHKANVISEIA